MCVYVFVPILLSLQIITCELALRLNRHLYTQTNTILHVSSITFAKFHFTFHTVTPFHLSINEFSSSPNEFFLSKCTIIHGSQIKLCWFKWKLEPDTQCLFGFRFGLFHRLVSYTHSLFFFSIFLYFYENSLNITSSFVVLPHSHAHSFISSFLRSHSACVQVYLYTKIFIVNKHVFQAMRICNASWSLPQPEKEYFFFVVVVGLFCSNEQLPLTWPNSMISWRNEFHKVYVFVCVHQIHWDFLCSLSLVWFGSILLSTSTIFNIHEADVVLLTIFLLTQFDSVNFTVKPDECGHSSGDKSHK